MTFETDPRNNADDTAEAGQSADAAAAASRFRPAGAGLRSRLTQAFGYGSPLVPDLLEQTAGLFGESPARGAAIICSDVSIATAVAQALASEWRRARVTPGGSHYFRIGTGSAPTRKDQAKPIHVHLTGTASVSANEPVLTAELERLLNVQRWQTTPDIITAHFESPAKFESFRAEVPAFAAEIFTVQIRIPDFEPEAALRIATAMKPGRSLHNVAATERVLELLPELMRHPGYAGVASIRQIIDHTRRSIDGACLSPVNAVNRAVEQLFPGDVANLSVPAVSNDPWSVATNLVGLGPVLQQFERIAHAAAREATPGGRRLVQLGHYVLIGPPGTGKTTVARCAGSLFHELGLLQRSDVVVATRADLVGEYIGQTAPKVRRLFQSALGGVLFIDEAYTLVSDSERDYGHEALGELVKLMEEYRGRVVVLFAAYPEPMQRMLDVNPGMRSRISRVIPFPELGMADLVEVVRRDFAEVGVKLGANAERRLRRVFAEIEANGTPLSARVALRCSETALANAAWRTRSTPDAPITVAARDIELPHGFDPPSQR